VCLFLLVFAGCKTKSPDSSNHDKGAVAYSRPLFDNPNEISDPLPRRFPPTQGKTLRPEKSKPPSGPVITRIPEPEE